MDTAEVPVPGAAKGAADELVLDGEDRGRNMANVESEKDAIGTVGALSTEDESGSEGMADLLEFEVDQIRKDDAKRGWTTWLLLGALAGLVWTFLGKINPELDQENWKMAAFCAGVLLAACNAAATCGRVFGDEDVNRGRSARFRRFGDMVGSRRAVIAVLAVSYAFIATVAFWSRHTMGGIAFAVVGLCGLFAVLAVGMVALSYMGSRLPFPLQYLGTRSSGWASGILSIMDMAPFIVLVICLLSGAIRPSANEWQLGLLAGGALIVVRLIATNTVRPLLMRSLSQIRRDLGMGVIDAAQARERMRLVLDGLGASEVLQDEVAGVLGLISRGQMLCASMRTRNRGVSELVAATEAGRSPSQDALVKAAMEAGLKDHQAMREVLTDLRGQVDRFFFRAEVVARVCGSHAELLPLKDRLKQALGELEADFTAVVEEYVAQLGANVNSET